MISDFSTHAKPSNNKARVYAALSFIFAVAAFLASLPMTNYRWAPQLLGMLLVIAGLVLTTRYVSAKYYYEIMTDSEGAPLFIVRQRTGKRQITLCRIYLADIQKIEPETKEQRRAHKTPTGYTKFIYVPTFLPEDTVRITASGRYERSEIVIECSAEMCSLLSDCAAEARAARIESEE